jgi:prevent-host-death family protein
MASKPIDLEQASVRLKDLVDRANRGEEVILSEGGAPVARLTPLARRAAARRFGSAKGLIRMREDFDEPLDDFRPYT